MTTVQSVLAAYGKGLELDDFARQLEGVLRQRVAADPRALSRSDRQILTEIGVPADDLNRPLSTSLVEEAAELLLENSTSLSAAAVASRLGRSVTRIRGAIADGSLYGVKIGRSWLLPTWQLTDEPAPLPHLRKVIAAVPEGASPSTIQRVMTQPSDELYLDGTPTSPRRWLLAGQDPKPVVTLIEQLYAW